MNRASVLLSLLVLSSLSVLATGQPVLPPGYGSTLFHNEPAGSLPTSLTVDDQGRVYLLTGAGLIKVLEDTNGDGVAETVTTYFSGATTPPCVGLLWFQGDVYMSQLGKITILRDTNGDLVADSWGDIITGLPVGWHQNNDLFTDGTHIYFGLGSVTDHDVDPDPRSATLMRMDPGGANLTIFATGLRNVFDGVAHPVTGDILVGDNGPNLVVGNPHPPDELNWVVGGNDYGHPKEWGAPMPGSLSRGPLLELAPHGSPVGMAINPNVGISGHRSEIMMGIFTFGAVVRIPVVVGTPSGTPGVWWEPWAVGFVNPIDLEFTNDGALYVADYSPGSVWRITQTSPATITVDTPPSIGTVSSLSLNAPAYPGHLAYAGASLDFGVTQTISPGVGIYIDVFSPMWWFSITPGNGVFQLPSPGLLDGLGGIGASIAVPNDPAFIGVSVRVQWVVSLPTTWNVIASSPAVLFEVQPVYN